MNRNGRERKFCLEGESENESFIPENRSWLLGDTQSFINDFPIFFPPLQFRITERNNGDGQRLKIKRFHKFRSLIDKIIKLGPYLKHGINFEPFYVISHFLFN